MYITEAGVDSLIVVDPAVNKIVTQIPVGVSPHYANFTADGKRGLTVVQGPSLLAVFNPQTNTVEKSIKVGSRPHWVAVPAGNKTALTANEDSNDVSVVDLESGSVSTITVGGMPRKIAVQSSSADRASSNQRISISGFAFSPPLLEVSPGETVTWTNDDGAPHQIILKNGTASDVLMPTKSYSSKFSEVGSYDYFCEIHPYMTGKIVVTERHGGDGPFGKMMRRYHSGELVIYQFPYSFLIKPLSSISLKIVGSMKSLGFRFFICGRVLAS